MSNFEVKYKLILGKLQKLEFDTNYYFKPIQPKLFDLYLVIVNITAEFLDSEYYYLEI
jgi:hypothetical protein